MRFILLLLGIIFISACSKVEVIEYRDAQPKLNFFGYFEGPTKGWGIVQDRNGKVTRQFVVAITGELSDQQTLLLRENFEWNDGEKTQRTWTIRKTGERTFFGTADDVVGSALGSVYGNALHWQYVLNIEAKGSTWKIHLDDWMYLQPDNILINRTKMSKFGIHLGDITIVFRKEDSFEGRAR